MNKETIVKIIDEEGVRFVDFHFIDIDGSLKNTTLPVARVEQALEKGVWFDGSSISGFVDINHSDLFLKPDPKTFAIIPWTKEEEKTARIICDVYNTDGTPYDACPRNTLKRVCAKAEELGFTLNTGPEIEFFLFKKNEHFPPKELHDTGCYFDATPTDAGESIRAKIMNALVKFGISPEMAHHEVAEGQQEINFEYGDALTTADRITTFKWVVKNIAAQNGLLATFMPKPIFGVNGSGMHTHFSLFSGDEPMFYNAQGPHNLSKIALSFIAGVLTHIKSISAILSPTVNSYKRLTPGYEAPVYVCWGAKNRSALIRIPANFGNPKSTRAELRCPDPSNNPYLAFAAMLAVGLDGINKGLIPPDPVKMSMYDDVKNFETLPETLGQALELLQHNVVIREALGNKFMETYIKFKRKEWDSFRIFVTKWEFDRYFNHP